MSDRRGEPTSVGQSVEWHVVTCEYPPMRGGVADYTRLVGRRLVDAGDDVHVWCPAGGSGDEEADRVRVHATLGRLSPIDLVRTGRRLNRFPAPRRVLVQWVPHGYGYRSMNVPFCLWLWKRAAVNGDHVDIVAHEVSVPFVRGLSPSNVLSMAHRVMMFVLARSARRIWVTIPAWEARWQRLAPRDASLFGVLPVPSNVPVACDGPAIETVRTSDGLAGRVVVGHFGTFGRLIADPLVDALASVLRASDVGILLMGGGSEAFRSRLAAACPDTAGRLVATGYLDAQALSAHLAACDVLLQPFPDGVSARRGSVMAGLAHGKPVVTTVGELSEPYWAECGALSVARSGDPAALATEVLALVEDRSRREAIGRRAARFYEERFDVLNIVEALRGSVART